MASDDEACVNDPNFAIICSFFNKFGKICGVECPSIKELQTMLENNQEVQPALIDLHVKLLRKARKTVHADKWERALVKFIHTYSNQDAWNLEHLGYKKLKLPQRLFILKNLLEAQFDSNTKFKSVLSQSAAADLRLEPIGRDKKGNAYWYQVDDDCNLRVYKEDLDEEQWTLVAQSREELLELISTLTGPNVSGNNTISNDDSNSVATISSLLTSKANEDSTIAEESKSLKIDESKSAEVEESDEFLSPDDEENYYDDDNAKDGMQSDPSENSVSVINTVLSDDSARKKTKNQLNNENINEQLNKRKNGNNDQDRNHNSDGKKIKTDMVKDSDQDYSEVIEESTMIVTGQGSGADCNADNLDIAKFSSNETSKHKCSEVTFNSSESTTFCNLRTTSNKEPYFSDVVEEPVMYVIGFGSGVDCDAGDPNDNKMSEESCSENKESSDEITSHQKSTISNVDINSHSLDDRDNTDIIKRDTSCEQKDDTKSIMKQPSMFFGQPGCLKLNPVMIRTSGHSSFLNMPNTLDNNKEIKIISQPDFDCIDTSSQQDCESNLKKDDLVEKTNSLDSSFSNNALDEKIITKKVDEFTEGKCDGNILFSRVNKEDVFQTNEELNKNSINKSLNKSTLSCEVTDLNIVMASRISLDTSLIDKQCLLKGGVKSTEENSKNQEIDNINTLTDVKESLVNVDVSNLKFDSIEIIKNFESSSNTVAEKEDDQLENKIKNSSIKEIMNLEICAENKPIEDNKPFDEKKMEAESELFSKFSTIDHKELIDPIEAELDNHESLEISLSNNEVVVKDTKTENIDLDNLKLNEGQSYTKLCMAETSNKIQETNSTIDTLSKSIMIFDDLELKQNKNEENQHILAETIEDEFKNDILTNKNLNKQVLEDYEPSSFSPNTEYINSNVSENFAIIEKENKNLKYSDNTNLITSKINCQDDFVNLDKCDSKKEIEENIVLNEIVKTDEKSQINLVRDNVENLQKSNDSSVDTALADNIKCNKHTFTDISEKVFISTKSNLQKTPEICDLEINSVGDPISNPNNENVKSELDISNKTIAKMTEVEILINTSAIRESLSSSVEIIQKTSEPDNAFSDDIISSKCESSFVKKSNILQKSYKNVISEDEFKKSNIKDQSEDDVHNQTKEDNSVIIHDGNQALHKMSETIKADSKYLDSNIKTELGQVATISIKNDEFYNFENCEVKNSTETNRIQTVSDGTEEIFLCNDMKLRNIENKNLLDNISKGTSKIHEMNTDTSVKDTNCALLMKSELHQKNEHTDESITIKRTSDSLENNLVLSGKEFEECSKQKIFDNGKPKSHSYKANEPTAEYKTTVDSQIVFKENFENIDEIKNKNNSVNLSPNKDDKMSKSKSGEKNIFECASVIQDVSVNAVYEKDNKDIDLNYAQRLDKCQKSSLEDNSELSIDNSIEISCNADQEAPNESSDNTLMDQKQNIVSEMNETFANTEILNKLVSEPDKKSLEHLPEPISSFTETCSEDTKKTLTSSLDIVKNKTMEKNSEISKLQNTEGLINKIEEDNNLKINKKDHSGPSNDLECISRMDCGILIQKNTSCEKITPVENYAAENCVLEIESKTTFKIQNSEVMSEQSTSNVNLCNEMKEKLSEESNSHSLENANKLIKENEIASAKILKENEIDIINLKCKENDLNSNSANKNIKEEVGLESENSSKYSEVKSIDLFESKQHSKEMISTTISHTEDNENIKDVRNISDSELTKDIANEINKNSNKDNVLVTELPDKQTIINFSTEIAKSSLDDFNKLIEVKSEIIEETKNTKSINSCNVNLSLNNAINDINLVHDCLELTSVRNSNLIKGNKKIKGRKLKGKLSLKVDDKKPALNLDNSDSRINDTTYITHKITDNELKNNQQTTASTFNIEDANAETFSKVADLNISENKSKIISTNSNSSTQENILSLKNFDIKRSPLKCTIVDSTISEIIDYSGKVNDITTPLVAKYAEPDSETEFPEAGATSNNEDSSEGNDATDQENTKVKKIKSIGALKVQKATDTKSLTRRPNTRKRRMSDNVEDSLESTGNITSEEECGGKRIKMRGRRNIVIKKNDLNQIKQRERKNDNTKKVEISKTDKNIGKTNKKDVVENKIKGNKNDIAEKNENQKPRKRIRRIMGLIVDEAAIIAKNDESNVRQSRRIAQLKIKEEAERRKVEEITLSHLKEQSQKKRRSKNDDKEYKVEKRKRKQKEDLSSESEEDSRSCDVRRDKKKKKRGRKKNPTSKPAFDETKPWQSSSESSSDKDGEEDDIEFDQEHSEDEQTPELKSDHEFSPESDLDGEYQPTRRARTAKKDIEETDISTYDDQHCQQCGKSDQPEWILLCDACDCGYHCSCLKPVLFIIPEGDWYCPPCQHKRLILNLQTQLAEFDKLLQKKEDEDLMKSRLNYVSISEKNDKNAKERHKEEEENESDSSSQGDTSSSEDSDSEDESGYKLRERRAANVCYRFNDYDELINKAIKDEMDVVKESAGNMGRGKDISTIIEAENEKKLIAEEVKKEVDKDAIDKNEKEVEKNEESGSEIDAKDDSKKYSEDSSSSSSDTERLKHLQSLSRRKKQRKLNALDVSSEEDHVSDEDFKGSSADSEDEELESNSDFSDSELDYPKKKGATRRSTRARITRYDKKFINDSDESSDAPKRKKKYRSILSDEDEESLTPSSEDSDTGWRNRRSRGHKKSKAPIRKMPKFPTINRSNEISDATPKKAKKKRLSELSDLSFRSGGLKKVLDQDELLEGRRTRGKKINYVEALASDSEEDKKKKKRSSVKQIVSEDEYVPIEEEKLEQTVENQDANNSNTILVNNETSNVDIESTINTPKTELLINSLTQTPSNTIQVAVNNPVSASKIPRVESSFEGSEDCNEDEDDESFDGEEEELDNDNLNEEEESFDLDKSAPEESEELIAQRMMEDPEFATMKLQQVATQIAKDKRKKEAEEKKRLKEEKKLERLRKKDEKAKIKEEKAREREEKKLAKQAALAALAASPLERKKPGRKPKAISAIQNQQMSSLNIPLNVNAHIPSGFDQQQNILQTQNLSANSTILASCLNTNIPNLSPGLNTFNASSISSVSSNAPNTIQNQANATENLKVSSPMISNPSSPCTSSNMSNTSTPSVVSGSSPVPIQQTFGLPNVRPQIGNAALAGQHPSISQSPNARLSINNPSSSGFTGMPGLQNIPATPKRRGRGRGKKALGAEIASQLPPGTGGNKKDDERGTTSNLSVAAPPQPFSASHPSPSIITRMLLNPTSSNNNPRLGLNSNTAGQTTSIPNVSTVASQGSTSSPSSYQGKFYSHDGYLPRPRGQMGPAHGLYRPQNPMGNYPPRGMYHSPHHPLDPSPSGGGPINVQAPPSQVRGPPPLRPGTPPKTRPPYEYLHQSPGTRHPPFHHNQSFGYQVQSQPQSYIQQPPQYQFEPSSQQPTSIHQPMHTASQAMNPSSVHSTTQPILSMNTLPQPVSVIDEQQYNNPESQTASKHVFEQEGELDEETGEFGGLVSYFSSQREDDLET